MDIFFIKTLDKRVKMWYNKDSQGEIRNPTWNRGCELEPPRQTLPPNEGRE